MLTGIEHYLSSRWEELDPANNRLECLFIGHRVRYPSSYTSIEVRVLYWTIIRIITYVIDIRPCCSN